MKSRAVRNTLGNILGKLLGIQWEHIGNLMETQWELEKPPNAPTLPQKKKKTWAPGCMLPHLIGCKNVLAYLYSCHFWPSLIVGGMNCGRIVLSTLGSSKEEEKP
jgi:hypothetical protein